MQQFTAREKFRVTNTLNCLPVMLQGYAVLIDLRNETSVAGIIENADGSMNINLLDAVFIDRNGGQHAFEQFMLRSRMIRQIHIPAALDIEHELRAAIERGLLTRPRSAKSERGGKKTFKQKRAEQKHKEILLEISKQLDAKE